MAKFHTHYDNLKVTRDAPVSVIKAAYKALCQTYHPDKFQDNTEEAERVMKLVNASYAVLIDPTKRAKHNAWIREQETQQPQSEQPPPQNQENQDTQQDAPRPPPNGNSVKEQFQRAYDLHEQGRYAEALKIYQYLAGQDHADAQFKLGLMYELGQSAAQNYSQAVFWYQKAADQGNTNAQYNLALKYQSGQGVTKDPAQAAYWFGKAAGQ